LQKEFHRTINLSLLTNHRNGVIVKVEDGKATAPPEGAVFHDFGDLVIMPGA
jgi:imidazolonepropionase-like amidohydrolase